MTPQVFRDVAWVPAMKLLPATMDSPEALAMVVSICLQESRLVHRRQIGGPARGFAQFELGGGVRGVLNHAASKPHIRAVMTPWGLMQAALVKWYMELKAKPNLNGNGGNK